MIETDNIVIVSADPEASVKAELADTLEEIEIFAKEKPRWFSIGYDKKVLKLIKEKLEYSSSYDETYETVDYKSYFVLQILTSEEINVPVKKSFLEFLKNDKIEILQEMDVQDLIRIWDNKYLPEEFRNIILRENKAFKGIYVAFRGTISATFSQPIPTSARLTLKTTSEKEQQKLANAQNDDLLLKFRSYGIDQALALVNPENLLQAKYYKYLLMFTFGFNDENKKKIETWFNDLCSTSEKIIGQKLSYSDELLILQNVASLEQYCPIINISPLMNIFPNIAGINLNNAFQGGFPCPKFEEKTEEKKLMEFADNVVAFLQNPKTTQKEKDALTFRLFAPISGSDIFKLIENETGFCFINFSIRRDNLEDQGSIMAILLNKYSITHFLSLFEHLNDMLKRHDISNIDKAAMLIPLFFADANNKTPFQKIEKLTNYKEIRELCETIERIIQNPGERKIIIERSGEIEGTDKKNKTTNVLSGIIHLESFTLSATDSSKEYSEASTECDSDSSVSSSSASSNCSSKSANSSEEKYESVVSPETKIGFSHDPVSKEDVSSLPTGKPSCATQLPEKSEETVESLIAKISEQCKQLNSTTPIMIRSCLHHCNNNPRSMLEQFQKYLNKDKNKSCIQAINENIDKLLKITTESHLKEIRKMLSDIIENIENKPRTNSR